MPKSNEFFVNERGPKEKMPNFLIGNINIFQLYLFSRIKFNSFGSLNGISKEGKLDDARIDNSPIMKDKEISKRNGLHHTLKGRKLKIVIPNKQITKPTLQKGPAQIGVIKKIDRMINLSLQSIILNQLLLPSTYCPIGNLVRIFIIQYLII